MFRDTENKQQMMSHHGIPANKGCAIYRSDIYCNTLLSYFRSVMTNLSSGRLKTNEMFKLLALKVFTVAYESLAITRGSKGIMI